MKPALDRKLHTRAALLEVLATGSWLARTGWTESSGAEQGHSTEGDRHQRGGGAHAIEFVCWMEPISEVMVRSVIPQSGEVEATNTNQAGTRPSHRKLEQQRRHALLPQLADSPLGGSVEPSTHTDRTQAHHSSSGDAIGVCDVGTGRQRNTQVDGTSTLSQQPDSSQHSG